MNVNFHSEVAGRFLLEAVSLDAEGKETSRRVLADWFDNMILDGGLDAMGTVSFGNGCVVGGGSTPPAAGQTGLTTFIAGSSSTVADTSGAQGSAPYYGWRRRTFRFNAGVAAGNLSEIGITISSVVTADSQLFSRALIVDGAGNPTTITILAGEILDATYECRMYPALADVVTTEVINGVSTTVTVRASSVTGGWGGYIFQIIALDISSALYTGDIGAITSIPAGHIANLAQGVGGAVTGTYVVGSYTRRFLMSLGVGNPNTIGAANFITSRGFYQFDFEPKITLLTTQTFSLTISVTWARKTLP